MRAVLILVAVGIIAALAWFAIGSQEGEPVVNQPVESETPASDETSEASDDATDAVEDAVEQVQDVVNEAAEEAETAVNEAIDDAAENVNEAVDSAAARINDAVSDVLGGGEDVAANSDTGNVDAGSEAGESDALMAALTVDGFDPEMLKVEVADSNMSPVQRLAAKVLIEQAEADPGKIAAVIQELKKGLNVE